MAFIYVRHNIEVAHRLINLPGKCEQIHGHSMWVELRLYGWIDDKGTLDGLDFGTVKKHFREYLDTKYDHHLLLNEQDPWAQLLVYRIEQNFFGQDKPIVMEGSDRLLVHHSMYDRLPGLVTVPGDPTTENIAKWIAEWSAAAFGCKVDVTISETNTNGAGYTCLRPTKDDHRD